MSRSKLILIPAIVLALGISGNLHAGFVTNGSFEDNVLAAGTKEYFASGGTSVVTGWSGGNGLTFLDSAGSAANGTYLSVYGPFPSTSPDGGNFVEADAAPSYRGVIYQSISGLTVGQLYSVSFYQAAGQQTGFTGTTTERWLVGLGDNLTDSMNSAQASSMFTLPQESVGQWQAQTLYYSATTTTEVLSFLADGTPNGEPPISFLDGVSMNAIPEPSAIVLTALGMFGFGFISWRNHRKVAVA